MNTIPAKVSVPFAAAPESVSDEELLERMREDDADAYRVLVERHMDRAYAVALRVVRNQADAEDVAQDVLVKTWTNRQAWQAGRARFSTWLYRVIINRCIDLKRAPSGETLEDVPEPMDESDDAVATIHRQEMSLMIETALGHLPTQQRVAVVLSYYEDRTNSEVAEIMGTSIDAVESLLKRGRQRLRELLRRPGREMGGINI